MTDPRWWCENVLPAGERGQPSGGLIPQELPSRSGFGEYLPRNEEIARDVDGEDQGTRKYGTRQEGGRSRSSKAEYRGQESRVFGGVGRK